MYREAARSRYLPTAKETEYFHSLLADFFLGRQTCGKPLAMMKETGLKGIALVFPHQLTPYAWALQSFDFEFPELFEVII
jgi:hypothetical protein